MAVKFTQLSNITHWQVYAGAELVGTFANRTDAFNAGMPLAEKGEGVVVYGFTHDSTQVLQVPT